MLKSELKHKPQSKSAMTLLLLIACLVIATLVVISNYFFRPGLEVDLRNRVITKLHSYKLFNPMIQVEGRDVVLNGIARNKLEAAKIEAEIQSISGVHKVENKLLIHDQSD